MLEDIPKFWQISIGIQFYVWPWRVGLVRNELGYARRRGLDIGPLRICIEYDFARV